SPDLKSALVVRSDDRTRLRLLGIDGSPPRDFEPAGLQYQWARFFPDGKSLLALASETSGRLRLYRVPLDPLGRPIPMSPPTAARNVAISPDGTHVAMLNPAGQCTIYSTAPDETPKVIPNRDPLAPILWADPQTLYVQRQRTFSEIPAVVFRMN